MPIRFRVDKIDDSSVDWTCLGEFSYWKGTTVLWELGDEPEHGGTWVLAAGSDPGRGALGRLLTNVAGGDRQGFLPRFLQPPPS